MWLLKIPYRDWLDKSKSCANVNCLVIVTFFEIFLEVSSTKIYLNTSVLFTFEIMSNISSNIVSDEYQNADYIQIHRILGDMYLTETLSLLPCRLAVELHYFAICPRDLSNKLSWKHNIFFLQNLLAIDSLW